MNQTVLVLFGGRSTEHEISILSAEFVYRTLSESSKNYHLIAVYVDQSGQFYGFQKPIPRTKAEVDTIEKTPLYFIPGDEQPIRAAKPSVLGQSDETIDTSNAVLFPVLHGPNGEDGTLQGFLRMLNLPFVGCDVLGSALCMDKAMMKPVLAAAGIDSARYIIALSHQPVHPADIFQELGETVFVKPARQGSSVGVSKATSADELILAMQTAFRYDSKILIEEAIIGREIECSVLGNEEPEASLPAEIVMKGGFYSYDAKYIENDTAQLHIPADLPSQDQKRIRDVAIRTYKALDCEGMARVDTFFTASGRVVVNEVNTIPGFTQISMYPKMWQASGLQSDKLMDRLVQSATDRHTKRSKFETQHG